MTRSKKIPEFKNREEEAEFWDTHSTADYEDYWKPVRVVFAKNLSSGITVRLNSDVLKKLREKASEKGIGPTTLIRMWVMERLNKEYAAV